MEEIVKPLGCDVLMYDDREWQIKWRKGGGDENILGFCLSHCTDTQNVEKGNRSAAPGEYLCSQFYSCFLIRDQHSYCSSDETTAKLQQWAKTSSLTFRHSENRLIVFLPSSHLGPSHPHKHKGRFGAFTANKLIHKECRTVMTVNVWGIKTLVWSHFVFPDIQNPPTQLYPALYHPD